MADVLEPGFRKCQCHAITNKYPETASIVQVHKVFSNIVNLVECTPAKLGKISEWTTVVNSAEEDRSSFCKVLDGKLLFSVLYSMDRAIPNEMKAVLKMSAQAERSEAVNKTSLESTA
jgi:hypothetical protein